MSSRTIFWFRRDLRIDDNHGLKQALDHAKQIGGTLLPIFIFDTDILSSLARDDARVGFIHEAISSTDEALRARGAGLEVHVGKPAEIFAKLCSQHKISTVFANEDYEPYAIQRDTTITALLKKNGAELHLAKDQVLFAKSDVTKDDGTPYKVFTPYSRRWLAALESGRVPNHHSADEALWKTVAGPSSSRLLSLGDIGFKGPSVSVARLRMTPKVIERYAAERDHMNLDATSKIGVHLRFGTVSVRQAVKLARAHSEIWLKELIWREFFMMILFHFPQTVTEPFDPRFKEFPWRESDVELKRWQEGLTGYPIVDAGMRELNQTGFMHNRARMIVGSFLCKHLLLNWKLGERYFAAKLFDYDLSSNIGNWQWVAGCGVDAAPFFRIFNPTLQAKKFDRPAHYVKRWVPEYGTPKYPDPIVDHEHARRRALTAYSKIKTKPKNPAMKKPLSAKTKLKRKMAEG